MLSEVAPLPVAACKTVLIEEAHGEEIGVLKSVPALAFGERHCMTADGYVPGTLDAGTCSMIGWIGVLGLDQHWTLA